MKLAKKCFKTVKKWKQIVFNDKGNLNGGKVVKNGEMGKNVIKRG